MATIEQASGVSWRTLLRIDSPSRVADAAFTPEGERTPIQDRVLRCARQVDEAQRNRMANASMARGRVNGEYLSDGQPRGQKRRK